MKVYLISKATTFFTHVKELSIFPEICHVGNLLNEDLLFVCSYINVYEHIKDIQLIHNYSKNLSNTIVDIDNDIIKQYVIHMLIKFYKKKLLIMDGNTFDFMRYTQNIPLKV